MAAYHVKLLLTGEYRQPHMQRFFRELRLHRAKPPQEFVCDLLREGRKYVVLRYTARDAYTIGGTALEKGTVTIAHYWSDRNYVLWKFKKPDDTIIGYLFHIVSHPEIGKDFVRYLDLELDIWFTPDGTPTILDQNEVNDYYRRGIFDEQTCFLIEQQKTEILGHFKTILHHLWSEEPRPAA